MSLRDGLANRQWPRRRDLRLFEAGTIRLMIAFPIMNEPISTVIENAIVIAWDYLERTGELGDAVVAGRVLLHSIETMVFRGERRRLMLANKAISDHRKFLAEREAA
jgi:hypothetical protein